MKNLFLYCVIICITIFSCSKDNDTIIDDIDDDTIVDTPVAVDDLYTTSQDTNLLIQDMLDNDTIFDFVRIASFDEQTTNSGTIESRGNNNYLYTPPSSNFIGEDSFTYTICDNLKPINCSTATVTITVEENISTPSVSIILRDDIFFGEKDATLNITNLLDNDYFQGLNGVNISSLDNGSTNGTIALNSNTVSYTPATGFTGTDTFNYEVCTTEDPIKCESATVTIKIGETINFDIPNELLSYYDGALFFQDSDLMTESLQYFTEKSHTTKLEYTQRHDYLYDADADMTNSDNVILIYSSESRFEEEYQGNGNYNPQTFNTEHVYPQSFLDGNDVAISDLHLLRVCDAVINTSRSNNPFVDGSGTYGNTTGGWYPGDEWRGDVARIVFYVNMYYDESISDVGTLSTLLKWNIEDPVSAFEEQRNQVIFTAQGNRNPFIDNPYLATLIWGGDAAENKWQ